MSRALIILAYEADRQKAARWVMQAPVNTRVEFKKPRRTVPQSDKMWAMLTEISEQKTHHGIRLDPDDWKKLFVNQLHRELRLVPNLDGNGFVALNNSSSDLSVSEMSDLIELILAWGSAHDVQFKKSAA